MPGHGHYYRNEDITSESLRNIRLPEKIRCERCNKFKGQSNFARKRLNDLREKILRNKGPFTSQCTLCVPRQVMELRCFICEKDKGLEDFAKAQRKNPDHARCNDCMKQQLSTEPIETHKTYHGEILTNSDSDDEVGDSSDEEFGDLSEVTSSYADSAAGTATGNLVGDFENTSFNDTASTTTGGFWTPIRDRSAAGGSAAANAAPGSAAGRSVSYAASISSASGTSKGGVSSWSGFDPMKYGHPRSSAASVADSMETNRPASSSGSKWAKVKAFKPEPQQEPEKEEDHWGGDEEEEESSSDDDDSEDEYTMSSGRRR